MSSTLAIFYVSLAISAAPTATAPATQAAPAPVSAAAPSAPAAEIAAADKATSADEAPAKSEKPKPAANAFPMFPAETAVVQRTNAERARYGLRPLVIDRFLMNQARRHAAWMTQARSLQHTSAPVAENIAMGQRSSAEAMQSWMNSSGHRANILNSGYTRIGVAAYTTPEGSTYWCQQFLR